MGGAAQWDGERRVWAGERDVLAVDLPGFGAAADRPVCTDIGAFARHVLAEADRAGHERFHLLGHSMGGMVVQEMAALAPHRIDRLVLYGTAASGDLPDRFEPFEVSKRRAAQDGVAASADRIAANWFARGAHAPAYRATAALARRAHPDAVQAGFDAMRGWSRRDDAARIASPTLIVWGERDRTYGWTQTEYLWRAVPRASLCVLPDCGHAAHCDAPDLFRTAVGRFLRDAPH